MILTMGNELQEILARLRVLEDLVRHAPGLRTTYIGDFTSLVRLFNGRRLYVDSRDINHGQELMITGRWERANTALLQAVLKPGMTMVDVGANFGYFSMLAGPLIGATGRLHCFEPIPRVRELLWRSLKANGFLLGQRARVYDCAVGAIDGQMQLAFKEGDYSGGSLYTPPGRLRDEPFETLEVAVRPLDGVLADVPSVDFIKVDAEGSELFVWQGMQTLLARSPAAHVLMEFNQAYIQRHTDVASFVAQIKGAGFFIHRVTATGLEDMNPLELPPGNHYLLLARSSLSLRWTLDR